MVVLSPAFILQLLLEIGFYCIHSVPAVCFSSWITWVCRHVAATHVFQRMTKGSLPCLQLTARMLLLCLFRRKCYTLPCSFPFQSMSISRYLLKVFLLEIKTNQNKFLKFFSVTKISMLQEASPTCVCGGFSQQNLYSSTCMIQVASLKCKGKALLLSY